MPNPQQSFSVVDGHLVCVTTGTGGETITQRCSLSTHQLLAFEMQEVGLKGFAADSLVKHMKSGLEMDVTTDEVAIMLADRAAPGNRLPCRGCIHAGSPATDGTDVNHRIPVTGPLGTG
ncbi:MAG: hypothetical protein H7210_02530 [Pyrinomonadaceae bacterium]|nr:hypothetical protein [Phycisphaerales bacterium]